MLNQVTYSYCTETYLKKVTKVVFNIGVFLVVTSILLFLLLLATYSIRSVDYVQVIYINRHKPSQCRTSKKFLSIGLDSSIISEGFKDFNMTDKKLISMMKYLSPGFLRIGGNLADKLYFVPNAADTVSVAEEFYGDSYIINSFNLKSVPNFSMTGSQWLELTKLADIAELDIFFDLNALMRFENGSWDYRNAESLIQFSSNHNLKVNWELGNEPDSYRHKFNKEVNASQMAKDFKYLKNILIKYPLYNDSLLVGPDVTRPTNNRKESKNYLEDFVKNVGDSVNAITWHQYYLNGRTAQPKDFLNPEIFDYLKTQINTVKHILNSSDHLQTPIWLGETSSAYGGGAPNLSDTFIGSFIWADKLGLAAKMGIKVIMRQTIFKDYYALLDDKYNPNPDWWVSVLYKKLVGQEVVSYYTVCVPKVRLYVHCTQNSDIFANASRAITIFGVNLDTVLAKVRIEGLFPWGYDASLKLYSFELTSDTSLFSQNILLNGKALKMLTDNSLPVFVPKKLNAKPFVKMPPLSVVFWVIPNSHVKVCS